MKKRMPQEITGVDLLILAAERGWREVGENVDPEVAAAFAEMLETHAGANVAATNEMHDIAQRPGSETEHTVYRLIALANSVAVQKGNPQQQSEVLGIGIRLAMRFMEFGEAMRLRDGENRNDEDD